ncbi:hypothetical protein [Nostoc sp.]|uniref:hypothetical protein n=1 Tax=Nostoc sp. TaxID=1180 RepID=UPI002FF7A366
MGGCVTLALTHPTRAGDRTAIIDAKSYLIFSFLFYLSPVNRYQWLRLRICYIGDSICYIGDSICHFGDIYGWLPLCIGVFLERSPQSIKPKIDVIIFNMCYLLNIANRRIEN